MPESRLVYALFKPGRKRPQWFRKKGTCAPTSAPTISPSLSSAAIVPTVDYNFDNSLVDSQGGSILSVAGPCPANSPCIANSFFGTDDQGTFWAWSSTDPLERGGGFTVQTNQVIGDTYTMIFKFAFTETGSGYYRKIIDFKNRLFDEGLYFLDGQLVLYNIPVLSTTTFANDQVVNLVLVRKSSGQLTMCSRASAADVQQVLTMTDAGGLSIPTTTGGGSQSLLGFFFDDTETFNEATPSGKVYDLRMWTGLALTPKQIATLPF